MDYVHLYMVRYILLSSLLIWVKLSHCIAGLISKAETCNAQLWQIMMKWMLSLNGILVWFRLMLYHHSGILDWVDSNMHIYACHSSPTKHQAGGRICTCGYTFIYDYQVRSVKMSRQPTLMIHASAACNYNSHNRDWINFPVVKNDYCLHAPLRDSWFFQFHLICLLYHILFISPECFLAKENM